MAARLCTGLIGNNLPTISKKYPFLILNMNENPSLASLFRFVEKLDLVLVVHDKSCGIEYKKKLERIIGYSVYHRIHLIAIVFTSDLDNPALGIRIEKTDVPFSQFMIPKIYLSLQYMESLSADASYSVLYKAISSYILVNPVDTNPYLSSDRLWSSDVQIGVSFLNKDKKLFSLSEHDLSSFQQIIVTILFSGNESLSECEDRVTIFSDISPSTPITWGAAIQEKTEGIESYGWYYFIHQRGGIT